MLTRDWVAAAAARGLNRASLGVQNLSPQVQRAVNRPESFEDIRRCVGWLREAGVASINLDLMYGLPRQTTQNTLSTLDLVLGLRPERLALFGYAHVPWMKTHQRLIDEAALPGPQERLRPEREPRRRAWWPRAMCGSAWTTSRWPTTPWRWRSRRAACAGTSRDTRPTRRPASSASAPRRSGACPRATCRTTRGELDWRDAVRRRRLPVARGVAITAEDRFRAEIIERLMCDFEVDLAAVSQRHGRDEAKFAAELARLQAFVDDGLVQLDGSKHQSDEPRAPVRARSIAAVFDQYFHAEAVRHSRAI